VDNRPDPEVTALAREFYVTHPASELDAAIKPIHDRYITSHRADHHIDTFLCAAAGGRKAVHDIVSGNTSKLDEYRKQLAIWADRGPDDFVILVTDFVRRLTEEAFEAKHASELTAHVESLQTSRQSAAVN